MFTDETLEGVNFKSSWKKERSLADGGTQTDELEVFDQAVQSYKYRDEAVRIFLSFSRRNKVQTDEEHKKKLRLAEDVSGNLGEFLHRIEPYLSRQLTNNLRSRAFDGFDQDWDEESSGITCEHSLSHPDFLGKFQVTGLSWNCTGSVIAASFGQMEHEDWCTHKTSLCTWNLDRRNIKEEKPDTVIELPSCLMCLAFHPRNPAIIAGGTFNGEVILWDLSREDDLLVASSGIDNDSHQEPVSKVHWITDSKGKKIYLISTSSDGKILQWKIDRKAQKLQLKDGFMLMSQSLPRKMKVKGVRGDKEVGVTCITYNSEDKDMFLVGSEAGAIFKCSMHAQGNPAGSHVISSVPLHSPVTFTYNPHHGPVYSVECSPFHRNAFLSAGMDQCIRLYSILQAQPVLTIEPGEGYIYSAKWSPVKATVMAATTQSGHLLIYDFKQGKPVPVHKLQASPQKQPVYTCQFNPQTNFIATGDGTGFIQIFKLSSSLKTMSGKELDIIGNLVTVAADQ